MTKKKKINGNGNSKRLTVLGRPTRYKKELDEVVYKLCLLNAIDTQIADVLMISEKTLNTWKEKHPSFLQSIKRGKEQADAEVAKMLFHRACGYKHKETKVFCYEGEIVEHEVIKNYPPETAAACFWLKNRAGWKDAQDYNLNIRIYTQEERDSIRKQLASRCVNAQ